MKPAWFDYYAPRTLEEALRILGEAGADGRVLAGGQSLMPMLNFRLASPAVLVDINRIAELGHIEAGRDHLALGALVRHASLLEHPGIAEGWPLIPQATSFVAHPAIRNRGTVCGSCAHNDPAAEQPGVLTALDGTVVLASRSGRRELAAADFFTGMMSTALQPGEMVVGLKYPRPAPGTSAGFAEFARRLGDFAIAGATAVVTLEHGICTKARLVIIGMGHGPVRAHAAEATLTGRHLAGKDTAAVLADAAAKTRAEVAPADDVHATTAYRRHLAGVMATRAIAKALASTKGR